jgi:hypothetical protein
LQRDEVPWFLSLIDGQSALITRRKREKSVSETSRGDLEVGEPYGCGDRH